MRYAGWLHEKADEADGPQGTEAAIRMDSRLSEGQKQALLLVYRGFVETED